MPKQNNLTFQDVLEQIRQGCVTLELRGACRSTLTSVGGTATHSVAQLMCSVQLQRRTARRWPRIDDAYTARVLQGTRSVTREPRTWVWRSRATPPSPRWTSDVRAAARSAGLAPRLHVRRGVRSALSAQTCRTRPAAYRRCVRRPRAAGNKIGDQGAKDLGVALKGNTTLTTLDLRGAWRGACSSRGATFTYVIGRFYDACAPPATGNGISAACLAPILKLLAANKARPPSQANASFF